MLRRYQHIFSKQGTYLDSGTPKEEYTPLFASVGHLKDAASVSATIDFVRICVEPPHIDTATWDRVLESRPLVEMPGPPTDSMRALGYLLFGSEGNSHFYYCPSDTLIQQRTVFMVWTGHNEMSANRKNCIQTFLNRSNVKLILLTEETIPQYTIPAHPFHEGYRYLSEVHKADYVRTYLMHFLGGGYSDIKHTTGSWSRAFDDILAAPECYINGYPEIPTGVAWPPHASHWRDFVGNGCYICRPNTPFSNTWYSAMTALLDGRLEALRQHPASHPYDKKESSAYPIEWNEMLGRIFHRVLYDYKDRVLKTVPICIFFDYR